MPNGDHDAYRGYEDTMARKKIEQERDRLLKENEELRKKIEELLDQLDRRDSNNLYRLL